MILKRWVTLHPIGATANLVLGFLLVQLATIDPRTIAAPIHNPFWREVAVILLTAAIAIINAWKKVPPVDEVIVPPTDAPVDPNTAG